MTPTPAHTLGFDDPLLARAIAIVAARTRVDLGAYRSGTVRRRLRNRMAHLAIDDAAAYVEHLAHEPMEAGRLLENVLVKVSRFHRCSDTFHHVGEHVLPALARAAAGRPLRILCMGAGHGEEPWTFAMLLEQAGIAGVVVAADVDSVALFATARATYPASAFLELPDELRARYLEPCGRTGEPLWRVRPELRSRVRVELRDALRPPALPRRDCDLVSCRNLLIYLNPDAQATALGGLLGCARDGGVLLLGEAEWPPREACERLQPLAPRLRLFAVREPAAEARERTA